MAGKVKPVAKKPVSLATLLGGAFSARTLPVTKGDVANRFAWDSGALTIGDTAQRIVIVDGLFTALEAVVPARGDSYTEYTGMSVDSAALTPRKGGLGRLTITLVSTTSFTGGTATVPLRVKWEIDMAQTEKPLATHPKLVGYADADEQLDLWKNEPDRTLRKAFKYNDNGKIIELPGRVKTFAMKIQKGIESYIVFSPVITKVSIYDGRPDTGRCGYIGTPTVTVGDYEYLKTADRTAQNDDRTWTRTEAWTGADEWDTDLYTAPEA